MSAWLQSTYTSGVPTILKPNIQMDWLKISSQCQGSESLFAVALKWTAVIGSRRLSRTGIELLKPGTMIPLHLFHRDCSPSQPPRHDGGRPLPRGQRWDRLDNFAVSRVKGRKHRTATPLMSWLPDFGLPEAEGGNQVVGQRKIEECWEKNNGWWGSANLPVPRGPHSRMTSAARVIRRLLGTSTPENYESSNLTVGGWPWFFGTTSSGCGNNPWHG